VRARATFAPLSAFVGEAPRALGETLVVFSQGLSPNARLALERAPSFARAILFTSVQGGAAGAHDDAARAARERFERAGGHAIVLPPEREDGTLVRVLGPSAAMLAAALWSGAASTADLAPLEDALASAPERALAASADVDDAALARRVAFVTAGGYGEHCHAARNAWLESLCVAEPPSWDVLQIAHGPFQEFWQEELLLVALERENAAERELFDRLAQMLAPERHALVRLRSSLAPGVSALDHVAQTHELLCRALRARPRDLSAWPGRGRDGALYDVGS
jgi:creatinine amidohydrolase